MALEKQKWVAVCPSEAVAQQTIVCVRVASVHLLLIRDGDRIFACERACPREQADLSLGRVADGRLFCPRHLASFNLHDGNISAGWPSPLLRRYPVSIRNDQVWIDAEVVRTTK